MPTKYMQGRAVGVVKERGKYRGISLGMLLTPRKRGEGRPGWQRRQKTGGGITNGWEGPGPTARPGVWGEGKIKKKFCLNRSDCRSAGNKCAQIPLSGFQETVVELISSFGGRGGNCKGNQGGRENQGRSQCLVLPVAWGGMGPIRGTL